MKNPLRAVSKDESLSFRFRLPVVAENVLTIFIGLLFSRIISTISASALALMVLMMRENRSPMKIVSTFSATTGNLNRKERLSSLLTARRGFFM